MSFFGMGPWEITIILIVALIIFGPGKLPEVAGQVGKAVRDFRRMTSELSGEFEKTVGLEEIRRTVEGEMSGVKAQVNSVTSSVKKDLQGTGKASGTGAKTAKTGSTTSASTSVKPASSAGSTAKPASSAAGASKPATAAARPVATKADPLADVSFLEEDPRAAANGHAKAATSESKVAAAATAANGSPGSAAGRASDTTADALARARQRRRQAGYNRSTV